MSAKQKLISLTLTQIRLALACAVNRDKTGSALGKQGHQFCYEDQTISSHYFCQYRKDNIVDDRGPWAAMTMEALAIVPYDTRAPSVILNR